MNILITGVASGIGKALKEKYLESKHTVYGIDIIDSKEKNPNFKSYIVDITNEENLQEVFNELKDKKIKLDMIVNIAGIHKMASFVETKYQTMKKVIDINLLGTMLVNNTFHPLLKEKGKIIIITSEVASYAPLPFNGLYSVSKIALDAYAQSLRQELNLLNQKVITIRPGAVKTPLCDNSANDTNQLAENTVLYKNESVHFSNLVKKFTGTPLEPIKMANYIYKISLKKRPKYIYKKHQNIGLVLLSILPKRFQCWIIKLLLKRKNKNTL